MDKTQKEFDVEKWIESEKVNMDLCGTYPFCKYCDKSLSDPCSHAINKMKAKRKYIHLTFEEKLEKAKDETKEKYYALIESIHSQEYKTRMNKDFVSILYKNRLYGKICLTKNLLKVYLELDPNNHPEIKHFDSSEIKSYIRTPFTLKLSTKKAFKAVILLLEEIKKNHI